MKSAYKFELLTFVEQKKSKTSTAETS